MIYQKNMTDKQLKQEIQKFIKQYTIYELPQEDFFGKGTDLFLHGGPLEDGLYSQIEAFIQEHRTLDTFHNVLFKMIDERGLEETAVYKKANIDRRLFSKIRSDINYHPSKDTIILLGMSLELSEKEIEDLLGSASYSLLYTNASDKIIRYFFRNKIYDIARLNSMLDSFSKEYKCKPLNC